MAENNKRKISIKKLYGEYYTYVTIDEKTSN